MNANYRKHNDRSHNSSTYHKKDGTPVRARLKKEAQIEIDEAKNDEGLNMFTIEVDLDYTPVRGNALCSGDEAVDRACEDEILERLGNGDIWAWAFVTVKYTKNGVTGESTLGCCTYDSEEDFKKCSYYEDMCKEAKNNWHNAFKTELRAFLKKWNFTVEFYGDQFIFMDYETWQPLAYVEPHERMRYDNIR